jgi:hypothetical protein
MKGVPVARRIAAPGKLAGMKAGFGPCPAAISARYIFSLIEPIRISGRFWLIRLRTSSLSVLRRRTRATAKAQGRPRSVSRKWRTPRA